MIIYGTSRVTCENYQTQWVIRDLVFCCFLLLLFIFRWIYIEQKILLIFAGTRFQKIEFCKSSSESGIALAHCEKAHSHCAIATAISLIRIKGFYKTQRKCSHCGIATSPAPYNLLWGKASHNRKAHSVNGPLGVVIRMYAWAPHLDRLLTPFPP